MNMTNTYHKYCPNVWLAKTLNEYKKGDVIFVANKYGDEKESIIFNLIKEKDGYKYYSIIRNEEKTYVQRRIEKLESWKESSENKSNEFYEKSNKDRDFLSLAEPIKIGHHSEKRHRKIIDEAWNNMGKSVEYGEKAKTISEKIEYWKDKAESINLSMPESLEYYKDLIEITKQEHLNYKTGVKQQEHSYSMTYAKKRVNEAIKNYELAIKLWG